MRLEITTDDRAVGMIEEGYDLVIRVNPRADENLVGRAFLHDQLVVVRSSDLVRSSDAPVPAVIRGSADPETIWTMATSDGQSALAINPVLSLSSMTMVRDAVRLGVGIGRLPLSLVHDLASSRLVMWGGVPGPDTALWTLYPSRRLLSARVSAFLSFLRGASPKGTPEELAALID